MSKVIVIRHGKVNHVWKKNCTSAEFDEECRIYDRATIEPVTASVVYDVEKIYISTLDRSLQTAKTIFGERDFKVSNFINEVPLRSAFDSEKKLPLWFWNITGRLQWLLGFPRQEEGRSDTKVRARKFIETLCAEKIDCVVVTHGFFMRVLLKEMKKFGFKIEHTRTHYRNGEYVIAERAGKE